MVTIQKEDGQFIFDVKGLHKIWAFKSKITVPVDSIVRVHQNKDVFNFWKGIKMPGTSIPYLITAGTYFQGGKKVFWDVVNDKNCIIVELKDTSYNLLIVEVENPKDAIKILSIY
jgi:hypothetical protein